MIRDVFAGNLSEAFAEISALIDEYPVVAIDTEFPGFFDNPEQLALETNKPLPAPGSTVYSKFKLNVDNMRLIQLGLSLGDMRGRQPSPVHTWQFNFHYDESRDIGTDSSIRLLKDHNIDFPRLKREGIRPVAFSYELITSGLVYNKALTYICFHGNCDFGYLTKAVTNTDLPGSQALFSGLLRLLFPGPLYDLKRCLSWHSSLASLAADLGISRMGTQHQAGSDAYVTLHCFLEALQQNRWSESCNKSHELMGLDVI